MVNKKVKKVAKAVAGAAVLGLGTAYLHKHYNEKRVTQAKQQVYEETTNYYNDIIAPIPMRPTRHPILRDMEVYDYEGHRWM